MLNLGDMKSIRGNLLFISILNILLVLFSNNIQYIRISGIVEITDINNLKFYTILLILNLYAFRRYQQFLIKTPKDFNYGILLQEIIKNNAFSKITSNHFQKQGDKISVSKNGNILLNQSNIIFSNVTSNEKYEIVINLKKGGENKITLHDNSRHENLVVFYKNTIKILLLKVTFYVNERFYFDFKLPVWVGNLALIILLYNIGWLLFEYFNYSLKPIFIIFTTYGFLVFIRIIFNNYQKWFSYFGRKINKAKKDYRNTKSKIMRRYTLTKRKINKLLGKQ